MAVAAWPCLPNSQKKAKICWAFTGPVEWFKSWLGYLYMPPLLPPGWIRVKVISKRFLGRIPTVPYVPPGLFWQARTWPNQCLKKWQHRYCHRIHSKTASISRASLTTSVKKNGGKGSLFFCKPRFAYLVKKLRGRGFFFCRAKICLDFFLFRNWNFLGKAQMNHNIKSQ